MLIDKHTDLQALERIRKLPPCIQPHVRVNDPCWSYCPEGWRDLVEHLHTNLVTVHPHYEIVQIKEKFGGLRFYTTIPYNPHDIGIIVISYYESMSFRVCDVCGEVGEKQQIDGCFIATRCDQHNTNEERRAKVTEHGR